MSLFVGSHFIAADDAGRRRADVVERPRLHRHESCETHIGGRRAFTSTVLRVETAARARTAIVRLIGECDLQTADELSRALAAAEQRLRIVVDLSGLRFIDAHGLHACLCARLRADADAHAISFEHAGPGVARVFALAGLGHLRAEPPGGDA